jgi:hypothetical protein
MNYSFCLPPPLVTTLDALLDRIDTDLQGTTLIVGDAGRGKSSYINALAERAKSRGECVAVWDAYEAREADDRTVLAMLLSALGSRFAAQDRSINRLFIDDADFLNREHLPDIVQFCRRNRVHLTLAMQATALEWPASEDLINSVSVVLTVHAQAENTARLLEGLTAFESWEIVPMISKLGKLECAIWSRGALVGRVELSESTALPCSRGIALRL